MEDIHDLVGLGENGTNSLEGEGAEAKASGGIVKNMIANLVTGDCCGGVGGGEGGDIAERQHEENNGAVKEENHEEATGGIINNFISSLVSPRNRNTPNPIEQSADESSKPASGDSNIPVVKSEDRGTEDDQSESKGGIINNLISNMFHHQGERREDEESDVQKEDQKPQSGKSGIVDDIMSNLPIPNLGENAVPGTDEASMLIHSIVHD